MRKPEPHSPEPGKTDPLAERDRAALKARLDAFKADLGADFAPKDGDGGKKGQKADGGAMAKAIRASSELVAGVLVGGAIGYLLDQQLGTMPIFLFIFLMVGMAAGFLNLYRLGTRRTSGRDGDQT